MNPIKCKKILKFVLLIGSLALTSETFYFSWIYLFVPRVLPPGEMILIYSGVEDRTEIVRNWKDGPSPAFLLSGGDYTPLKLKRELESGKHILVEYKARTTDQNARYCRPIIQKARVHSIVLALPWYHLPRALFLTRLYLVGSGTTVTPYATLPVPSHWWASPKFYLELVKFWGSLGRIALSWMGIENWPQPSGG